MSSKDLNITLGLNSLITIEDPNYVPRMERLLEASRMLNSTLELAELTEIVLRIVQDEVPVDRCTLYVLDRRQNILRSFIAQGVDESEITLPVGQGLAGVVAETGEALDVDDAYETSDSGRHSTPVLDIEPKTFTACQSSIESAISSVCCSCSIAGSPWTTLIRRSRRRLARTQFRGVA